MLSVIIHILSLSPYDCVCLKFIIVYDAQKPEGHCGVCTHLRSET